MVERARIYFQQVFVPDFQTERVWRCQYQPNSSRPLVRSTGNGGYAIYDCLD